MVFTAIIRDLIYCISSSFFFIQKYAPVTLDGRGAKNIFCFSLGQDPCKNRSYAAGGARYLHADLMLLTHAKYAHKGPRGRFGISYPIAMLCTEQIMAPGSEIGFDRFCQAFCRTFSHFLQRECICHRSTPLHCAVTAGAGLLPFTPEKAGAAGTSIPFIVENAAYLYRSTRRVRCS